MTIIDSQPAPSTLPPACTRPDPRTQSAPRAQPDPRSGRAMIEPLIIDLVIPVGLYYGLHAGAHASVVLALTLSSILPLLRTAWCVMRGEELDTLAALILAVNVAGIVLSVVSGDPRLLFAKNSGVSSVVAVGILASALLGRPIMTAGLEPWMTRGEADRKVAWDRLEGTDRFRRYERRFSLIWGLALLAECIARLLAAFTLPIPTLAWLSTVLLIAAIATASLLGGVLAANPLQRLVDAEAGR